MGVESGMSDWWLIFGLTLRAGSCCHHTLGSLIACVFWAQGLIKVCLGNGSTHDTLRTTQHIFCEACEASGFFRNPMKGGAGNTKTTSPDFQVWIRPTRPHLQSLNKVPNTT